MRSGSSPVIEFTIEPEHLEVLEKIAKRKIEEWAENGSLIKHKKLASILYSWKHWDKDSKLESFIHGVESDLDSIVLFISAFVYKTSSHAIGDYISREHMSLNYKGVTGLIDASIIEPPIRSLYNSGDLIKLSYKENIGVTQFLEFFDGKRKSEEYS